MSKIKNGGLDQYGDEPLEEQQFGTAGTEWVKKSRSSSGSSLETKTLKLLGVVVL